VSAAPADRRTAVGLLSPRLVELVSQSLPDGAALVLRGDLLYVVLERRVHEDEIAPVIAFLLTCADLLPRYLLTSESTLA
jgi:hypothetical protein